MRACVFVDGENFRHSIVQLFPEFRQEDYLPKLASWADLFDWIVENVIKNGERIRTYWYVIESIDFFPYRFPDPAISTDPMKTREELQRLLSKHKPYQEELATLDASSRIARMTEIVKELRQRQDSLMRRFNGWITIQDGISIRHKAIEFRRAGAMTCNLFENSLVLSCRNNCTYAHAQQVVIYAQRIIC